MVLVGPSGCGKSTTLRMLAGLEEVNEGQIFIGDRDVTDAAAEGPRHRDGVPELRALPAHDGGRQHGASRSRWPRCQGRGARQARRGGGPDPRPRAEYLDRKPKALSGGQRQRVAMGRAIVRKPQVFCMDEPLSNLDAKMRVQTRTDIAKLQADLGVTTVYVTHDQVEAMTMGDRVAVMKDGVLQQVDTPLNLYDKPANLFVAGFIGSPADEPDDGHRPGGPGQGRRLPRAGRRRRPRTRRTATSSSACGPRRGGWSVPTTAACRSTSPWWRSSAPTRSSTAPAASRARPTTSSSASRRATRSHKGDVVHVTTDPTHVHVFDTDVRRSTQRGGAEPRSRRFAGPGRRLSARSAVRRITSVRVPNSSTGMSCPIPSMTRSSAPGMARAVARPPETWTILSAAPWTTAVGIRSERAASVSGRAG